MTEVTFSNIGQHCTLGDVPPPQDPENIFGSFHNRTNSGQHWALGNVPPENNLVCFMIEATLHNIEPWAMSHPLPK